MENGQTYAEDIRREELIRAVGQGDREAFYRLYQDTARPLYSYILSLTKSTHEAEDIMQEAFLTVWTKAAVYVPQGKPLAWLFTITKNLCRDLLRGQSRTEAAPDGAEDDLRFSYVSDPTDRLVLEAALKALGEEERQVVLLHAASGLKHREIARDLGLPLSTVLSRYSRALKKLKRCLSEEGVRL